MNIIADDFNKLRNLKEFELAGFSIIPLHEDSEWLQIRFLIKSKELDEYFRRKSNDNIS